MKRFMFAFAMVAAGAVIAQTPAVSDRIIGLTVLDQTTPTKPVKQIKAEHDWTLARTLKSAGTLNKNQTLAISCGGYNPKMASLPLQFDIVVAGVRTDNLKGLDDKDLLHTVCVAKAKSFK